MAEGTVKSFDEGRRYGFISQGGGGDVFVHIEALQGEGVRRLATGDHVLYDLVAGPKGPRAANVFKL